MTTNTSQTEAIVLISANRGRLRMPSRIRECAFTLVELLTVIAIVGILAAIVIPVVGLVRSRAQATACASNMRQVGLGLEQYAQDHRGLYPKIYGKGDDTAETLKTWMWKTAPYVGMPDGVMGPGPKPRSAGVFVCPDSSFDAVSSSRPAAYLYNGNVDFSWKNWGYRKSAVTMPAKTILLVEGNANIDYFDPVYGTDVVRRHPGNVANFLFVDGHVEAIAVVLLASDRRWQADP